VPEAIAATDQHQEQQNKQPEQTEAAVAIIFKN